MTIVQFYAFDILVGDGEDLRRLPLSMRKTDVSRLLARRKPRASRARNWPPTPTELHRLP